MKKVLPVVGLLFAAVGATAQLQEGVSLPISNQYNLQMAGDAEQAKPVVSTQNGFSDRAVGDTIWSDSFADLSNWTLGTTGAVGTADSLWEYTTDGPYGTFSGSWGDIQSTTVSDGWVMFDPDGNGSSDPVTGAPTGVEFDTYIMNTAPIDLSSYPVVAVTFQEFYKALASQTYLEVSTDGTSWTSYELHAGFAANDATAQNAVAYKDISAVAGGQPAVWVRLRYEGYGYFWQVDDIALVEGVENDLELSQIFHGDVIGDWEYEITPLAQAQSKYLGVVVTNSGGTEQTNIVCEYDILLNGNSVNNGSFTVSSTLASAVTDTGWFDTGFVPSEVGVYTIDCSVVGDQADATPANNTLQRVFEMSNYEWSHERQALWDGPYGGYVVSAQDQTLLEYSQGSIFVPVVDADLYAIKVSFGNSTTASSSVPLSLTLEVHTVGQNVQDIVDSEYQGVEITSRGWQTFILDDPISLIAGTSYILAVSTFGGDDVMTLNGWGVDADFGAVNYGAFGVGGAVNWFVGWDYSSAIRAVFDPAIGIEENEDVSGVNIYPNPTNDNLNINFVSKEDQNVTINVIGVDGALVFSENLSTKVGQANKTTVDFTNLAKGIYMVQLVGSNSALTQRVVVQ